MSKNKKAKNPVFNPKAEKLQQDGVMVARQISQDGEIAGQTIVYQMVFACMNFWMEQAKLTQKDRMDLVSNLMDSAMAGVPPVENFPPGYPVEELEAQRGDLDNTLRSWLVQSLGEKVNCPNCGEADPERTHLNEEGDGYSCEALDVNA
jgi:hypothetical protein